MNDIELLCPYCEQPLECPGDAVGTQVDCPVCGGGFMVPVPGDPAPAGQESGVREEMKYWTVDVRILVLRAPPAYFRILVEVPKSWAFPSDGVLPPPVHEALAGALKTRFPQRPITPLSIHTAEHDVVRRCEDRPDYCDAGLRVWLLGKPAAVA
jgi:hypothetical protein